MVDERQGEEGVTKKIETEDVEKKRICRRRDSHSIVLAPCSLQVMQEKFKSVRPSGFSSARRVTTADRAASRTAKTGSLSHPALLHACFVPIVLAALVLKTLD